MVPLAGLAPSIRRLAMPIGRSGSAYTACPAAGKPRGPVAQYVGELVAAATVLYFEVRVIALPATLLLGGGPDWWSPGT